MLSGFFKAKPHLTRFETTEVFHQSAIIVHKLHDKHNELKESADAKGPGSIDDIKYHIVADLLQKIDKVILEFNTSTFTTLSDEKTQILQAARKISEIISSIPQPDEKILKTSRNNQRENVSYAVYYGAFGTIFVAGYALSAGLLGTLATLLYTAPTASKSIHEATGLNDISPTSSRLLNELMTAVNHIHSNLKNQSIPETEMKESDFEDFICPITQEIINNPVICTLDGHAYEKTAIEEWFKHNRKSPLSRDEIPPHKTSNDVLVKHYNYISLLEKYRREHPTIAYTSACL